MLRHRSHTDTEYIRFFQSGEEKGFNFFFREFYTALCYFAFRITKTKSAAEDIAGDSFIKLWERHADFKTVSSIKSFLYITARNTSLNWVRQQKRENRVVHDIAYLAEENESSVFQKTVEAEVYQEILLALKTLPPKCRKIFRMLYFEGKDYRQIALELDLSVSTIRNQKARALLLIKQRIAISISSIISLQSIL